MEYDGVGWNRREWAYTSLFLLISAYSRLFQPIAAYSSHSSIPAYFSLFQLIPACSSIFQHIPAYSSLFTPFPAYIPIPYLQSPIPNLQLCILSVSFLMKSIAHFICFCFLISFVMIVICCR